jgi:hypothetical protein
MFSLKKSDLKKDDEGTLWIYKERQKTERAFSIPLIFSEPLEIIEKYKSESEYLLPRLSNQYFNRLLKEIAITLGITRNSLITQQEKPLQQQFYSIIISL